MQQHRPIVRHPVVGHREEGVVAFKAEVLERANRNDTVDALIELFPALQLYTLVAMMVRLPGTASLRNPSARVASSVSTWAGVGSECVDNWRSC